MTMAAFSRSWTNIVSRIGDSFKTEKYDSPSELNSAIELYIDKGKYGKAEDLIRKNKVRLPLNKLNHFKERLFKKYVPLYRPIKRLNNDIGYASLDMTLSGQIQDKEEKQEDI